MGQSPTNRSNALRIICNCQIIRTCCAAGCLVRKKGCSRPSSSAVHHPGVMDSVNGTGSAGSPLSLRRSFRRPSASVACKPRAPMIPVPSKQMWCNLCSAEGLPCQGETLLNIQGCRWLFQTYHQRMSLYDAVEHAVRKPTRSDYQNCVPSRMKPV